MDEPNDTPTPPSPAPPAPAPTPAPEPTPVPEPPRTAPDRGGLPVHEASAGSEEPEAEHAPEGGAAPAENTSPIPNAEPFDRTVDPSAGGPKVADTSTDYATRRPQELEPRSAEV